MSNEHTEHRTQNQSSTAIAVSKSASKLIAERGIATVVLCAVLIFVGWTITKYLDAFLQSQRDLRDTIERSCRK